jgi:hypothetical protein
VELGVERVLDLAPGRNDKVMPVSKAQVLTDLAAVLATEFVDTGAL